MKKLSILIPIHNRLQVTKIGLKHLFQSLHYYNNASTNNWHHDVIVIDDGSTDETKIIDQNDFDKDNNMKVSHGKKQHVMVKTI